MGFGFPLLHDELHVVFECCQPEVTALRSALGPAWIACRLPYDLKRLFSSVDPMALGDYFFRLMELFQA